jgi:hypothetical protein
LRWDARGAAIASGRLSLKSSAPRTPDAATAASIALPPLRSTSMAAFVASGSTLAAAPPVPEVVATLAGATT